ncbi:hypothetical protein EYF80_000866 [Liparis tanakae]|uniref:Uncharacterized protein n=1 Tax=Liparis tanakae TaxID=230148 RepID=A0A4Z2JH56_9TELE|nr:hypothetical protein EYF80_000866 [Liparis tanakae]
MVMFQSGTVHINPLSSMSHLEALDASQVVQLLCRLHRDAAGQGHVLPHHCQGGVACGGLTIEQQLPRHGSGGAGRAGAGAAVVWRVSWGQRGRAGPHVFGCHVVDGAAAVAARARSTAP